MPNRLARALAALLLSVAAAACASDGPPPPKLVPEKDTIAVGVLPVADTAPLFVAIAKGYFRQEGLTVEPQVISGAAMAVPMLEARRLDLGQTDYVTTFMAGAVGKHLKVVAPLSQAGADGYGVVVGKDSGIDSVKELKGKKVAVNNLYGLGTLMVTAMLENAGLTDRDVRFVEMPFPDMAQRIGSGKVDAAWVAEPFLTYGERRGLVRELPDPVPGRLADQPVSGWMATDEFRERYPRTLAAFQRGLAKGLRDAADRKEVEAALPKYTKIDADTAAQVSLGTYPTDLDRRRVQQVADLMERHGYLKNPLDVTSFLATG
ncbi:ABC transporter substrate-binding protein [Nonomuraea sp. NPDC050783]|uniref:ABC transporter substrate-binding protein n=1 Tax=Nonomuraea sp. NPDC050783 TaxID=3154634 RepID=UPI0034669ACB